MKTNPRLRAGVIGVGYLGRFHVEKYHALPDVDLVAVVDSDLARAQEVAGKYGARAYASHREALEGLDVVSVVVPSDQHYAVAVDCLDAQVHTLVEKPMTATLDEAHSLIEMAERRDLRLAVGHLERFNPAVLAMRERVNKPMFIEVHRLSPFKQRGTEVNVVLDLMIHDIDIVLAMVPSPIAAIRPIGLPVLSNGVDIAHARIEFECGCVANLTASRVSAQAMRKMRIFQQDSYLSLDLMSAEVTVHRKAQDETTADGLPVIRTEHLRLDRGDALMREIENFVAAVKGAGPVMVSGRDGARALEVALEINRSL
jgi:predicted dehydrogenase